MGTLNNNEKENANGIFQIGSLSSQSNPSQLREKEGNVI